jgi:hypothetical protein
MRRGVDLFQELIDVKNSPTTAILHVKPSSQEIPQKRPPSEQSESRTNRRKTLKVVEREVKMDIACIEASVRRVSKLLRDAWM